MRDLCALGQSLDLLCSVCGTQDSPIVAGGGRADAKDDAVKVELAHVGRLGP